MRFSSRVPHALTRNRLAVALEARRRRGDAILDLTDSNPTRAGFEYPADLLAPLADRAALRYDPQPFGLMPARCAVADDHRRHGFDVSPDRIVLTPSTSDAYSQLFKLVADAGDEVLVPRPSYPLFEHLTSLDLVVARAYDLEYHGSWTVDFASVERGLTARTRALLIVSPNNPTGSFIAEAELDRLAALCETHRIALIADEVFADYELEPGAAAAAGRALRRRDVLSFSLGGLSKSGGLPQVKLGWIAAAGPDAAVAAALERLELVSDTYLGVSTPVQIAAAHLIAAGAGIRQQIAGRVVANYRWLHAAVTSVPSCRVLRADAGWSAVIQVPALDSEEDLVVRLLTEDGVLVHPGHFFDFRREAFLIVSLLTPPAAFAEGVGRILRHFDCSSAILA